VRRKKETEELFRRVEHEVLDQQHRHFDLLLRSEEVAIDAVLRAYADVLRGLRTGRIPKAGADAKTQTANEGMRGLAHCLRWIRAYCPATLHVPTPPADQLAREGLDLLRWGVTYDPLWNQHSAYSGGLATMSLDERAKTITFSPSHAVDARFFVTQVEAKKADDERSARTLLEERLAGLSSAWYDSVRPARSGLIFDDSSILDSGALEVALEWMAEVCLPELPSATHLVSCNLADVRRVLAGLYVYSLFVTRLEDAADDMGTTVRVGPHVAIRSMVQMTDWLAELCGASRESVQAIVSALTFRPEHPHVTIAHQPLVSTTRGQMFLLPRMILFMDLPRMYVSAINSTEAGRAAYDRAIVAIEDAGVAAIASELRPVFPPPFEVIEKTTFALSATKTMTPDIVVASPEPEVLTIDVKYARPPLGPLDIRHDLKEMAKWKTKMVEYVTAFSQHPEILRQHFGRLPKGDVRSFGLILLRWPLPIPAAFGETVTAVDWPSLKQFLLGKGAPSAQSLMNWARTRPDVTVPGALTEIQREVAVGEWTYRYFVLSSSSS